MLQLSIFLFLYWHKHNPFAGRFRSCDLKQCHTYTAIPIKATTGLPMMNWILCSLFSLPVHVQFMVNIQHNIMAKHVICWSLCFASPKCEMGSCSNLQYAAVPAEEAILFLFYSNFISTQHENNHKKQTLLTNLHINVY